MATRFKTVFARIHINGFLRSPSVFRRFLPSGCSIQEHSRAYSSVSDQSLALRSLLDDVTSRLSIIDSQMNWNALMSESEKLSKILLSDSLWQDDPAAAIQSQKRQSELDGMLSEYNLCKTRYQDCLDLLELAKEENDSTLIGDIMNDLNALHEDVHKYSLRLLMSEEADKNGCFIEIRAGSGGTESCDWTSILTRMYQKWALANDFEVKLVDEIKGEIAGLKSSTLQINGEYAYGWLKYEGGVHRLVRISPFDSGGKRHTSFASVQTFPANESGSGSTVIEINEKDLKLEFMRAQGAGGQHVNKTESAVRIVHIPTGIIVACQNERSQHQNKATALQMLKAKLYQRELEIRAKEKSGRHEILPENAWGSQIRSYVLQPYQMIKDLRSGYESSEVDDVLNGDIQEYLESSLVHFGKLKASTKQ
ncbi:hypothetical protein HK098_005380 [Nowakowskiella sp. JEL0407]|nr:hypothetical protein HK098_005380 [Nowakowskiella sp. JEL0407]